MQISDMLGQYNRNATSNVSMSKPTPAAQQLVDAVREMTVGDVFEGTVNSMKKGQVTLGLSNGQIITAKLAANVGLTIGQSMFFQVKSNNGTQVEIKPYNNGNLNNPTLLKALEAAGIPANDRTIGMVNAMMEEQMPIDKQSLLDMVKVTVAETEINVETAVQMTKLNIPVTEEYAIQFENYKMDQSAITTQLNALMDSLPETLNNTIWTEEGAWNLNSGILDILLENTSLLSKVVEDVPIDGVMNPLKSQDEVTLENGVELVLPEEFIEQQKTTHNQMTYSQNTLGNIFDENQINAIKQQLLELSEVAANKNIFTKGELNLNLSAKEFLMELQKTIDENGLSDGTSIKKLLSGKEYQSLLKNVMEQQWLVKPEDIKADNKINELYVKLDKQMTQMEQLIHQTGQDNTQFAKATTDIHGNVEFMNEINKLYNYVQIPLKLSHQNAHSDLYVYTNKKNLQDTDGELSAFLHLDMDHLGSTDVSIKMHNRQIHTDFYMEDDKSYDLVSDNVDILEAHLKEKGFKCTVNVENRKKKVDFVEDFLKKDQPSTNRVHRYSFDVRA